MPRRRGESTHTPAGVVLPGTAPWYQSLVPLPGTAPWYRSLVPLSRTAPWYRSLVPVVQVHCLPIAWAPLACMRARQVHYLSVPLPSLDAPRRPERRGGRGGRASRRRRPAEPTLCETLTAALDWAESNPRQAEAIARAGRALVRETMGMESLYAYMALALNGSAGLLAYPPETARTRHRVLVHGIGCARPGANCALNATNFTRVPRDPDAFVRWLRNDTTYPSFAQIREADWEATVMRYNYSRMGVDFRTAAARHRAEVAEIKARQRREDEARRRGGAAAAEIETSEPTAVETTGRARHRAGASGDRDLRGARRRRRARGRGRGNGHGRGSFNAADGAAMGAARGESSR